jgi:hypothetical protein
MKIREEIESLERKNENCGLNHGMVKTRNELVFSFIAFKNRPIVARQGTPSGVPCRLCASVSPIVRVVMAYRIPAVGQFSTPLRTPGRAVIQDFLFMTRHKWRALMYFESPPAFVIVT